MKFNLIPLIGTDTIKFGMTRSEIQSHFKATPKTYKESVVDLCEFEDYGVCIVRYERDSNNNDICAAIEFIIDSNVSYNGLSIMGAEISEVEDIFKGFEKIKDSEEFIRLNSETNEIYIFACNDFLTPEQGPKVSHIFIASKGYSKRRREFLEANYNEANVQKIKDGYLPGLQEKIDEGGDTFIKEYPLIRLIPSEDNFTHQGIVEEYQDMINDLKYDIPDKTIESQNMYVNYETLNIPIGATIIGGPIVDLPNDISYPKDMYFLAQLNCKDLKKNDIKNLLPNTGYIFIFVKKYGEEGIVYYSPKEASQLKRYEKGHKECFFSGRLIKESYNDTETLAERFAIEEEGVFWDPFLAGALTKIYGAYTNSQMYEEEVINKIEELDKNRMIVLLQVGSDISYGVQNVLIHEDDLKALDFSKCIFDYSCD
jgi:uncharacterized protein YwqG